MVTHQPLELRFLVRTQAGQPWFDSAAEGGLAHHDPEVIEGQTECVEVQRIICERQ